MICADNIEIASRSIDCLFLNTPQYRSEGLSALLGVSLICKVETANPIGCFKGRGVDWIFQKRKDIKHVVTASAGNFGQALAYVGRRADIKVEVFAAADANESKVAAMRRLGAHVHLHGRDLDEAKDAAERFADSNGIAFFEDGREVEIAEGAGTIALELGRHPGSIDAIYVPVGNGALVSGVGAWCKAKLPKVKVIGVSAEGAPAMERSWRDKKIVVTDEVNTIADGIACRVPVPESLAPLASAVDDMILVSDTQIINAMRAYFECERLVIEPAGAATLAAAMANAGADGGKTIAVIATGSNIDQHGYKEWVLGS